MEIKKTGKLFSFCAMVPVIIKDKDVKVINFFQKMGSDIGLLFQIADDLIDYRGLVKKVGKKTKKDQGKGKATLISLLGYKKAVKYSDKIQSKIVKNLKKYRLKSSNINETLSYILAISK